MALTDNPDIFYCDACREPCHIDNRWQFEFLDGGVEVPVCDDCVPTLFGPATRRLLCRFVEPSRRPSGWEDYLIPPEQTDVVRVYDGRLRRKEP